MSRRKKTGGLFGALIRMLNREVFEQGRNQERNKRRRIVAREKYKARQQAFRQIFGR